MISVYCLNPSMVISEERPPTNNGIAMFTSNDFHLIFDVTVKKTTPFSLFILKGVVFIRYKIIFSTRPPFFMLSSALKTVKCPFTDSLIEVQETEGE